MLPISSLLHHENAAQSELAKLYTQRCHPKKVFTEPEEKRKKLGFFCLFLRVILVNVAKNHRHHLQLISLVTCQVTSQISEAKTSSYCGQHSY